MLTKYIEAPNTKPMGEVVVKDIARWYVIHTHAKQEDRVESNLRVLGVPSFNPKIRACRSNQFASAPTYVVRPLFPRYIFAQFKIDDLYHKIRFTRGVYAVISFGGTPTSVDKEIITMIQSNISKNGFVKIADDIKPGDKVIVKDGPFKNFAGIFEHEMRDADRVRILLQTVSYQAHVEIEKDLVVKLNSPSQLT
jgi:transcriptional antiterminator RfaH